MVVNYYRILGIVKNTPTEEIKRRYDEAKTEGTEMPPVVSDAYKHLSDPYLRGRYDMYVDTEDKKQRDLEKKLKEQEMARRIELARPYDPSRALSSAISALNDVFSKPPFCNDNVGNVFNFVDSDDEDNPIVSVIPGENGISHITINQPIAAQQFGGRNRVHSFTQQPPVTQQQFQPLFQSHFQSQPLFQSHFQPPFQPQPQPQFQPISRTYTDPKNIVRHQPVYTGDKEHDLEELRKMIAAAQEQALESDSDDEIDDRPAGNKQILKPSDMMPNFPNKKVYPPPKEIYTKYLSTTYSKPLDLYKITADFLTSKKAKL